MTIEEFDDIVNLLGNKILLEEDINKSIGRDWFKTKQGALVQDKKVIREAFWYSNSIVFIPI